jgi:ABC-type uncharacterized transport system fused permease/ATPase subunit
MSRRTLTIGTVSALAGLAVLVSIVPIGGRLAVGLLVVVIALVAFLVYLASIEGVERAAAEYGIAPWMVYAVLALLSVAWLAFRLGLLMRIP